MDFAVDLACLLLPLAFMWFGYQIPISISDMLLLTVWPTLSALMKIEELFEESIRQNYTRVVVQSEERKSFKMNRRRSSLFQQPVIMKEAEEQANAENDYQYDYLSAEDSFFHGPSLGMGVSAFGQEGVLYRPKDTGMPW